jgi:hypothetical protein
MNSKEKRDLTLIGSIVGVHIISLLIMWWFLSSDKIIETEFLKVISVTLTTNPSKPLPPINKAARDKVAKEKKQKIEAEEAAKSAKEKAIKDAKTKADNLKKAAEQKKIKDKTTKETSDKTKTAKADKTKKDKAAAKKKADKLKKDKAAATERANKRKKDKAAATARANKARAAKIAKDKAAAKTRADKAAKAAAYKRQQTAFGQHVYQKTKDQLVKEWNRLPFSIQFSDPNDEVKISITIRKDGTVLKAAILKKAKGQALNSQAQHLVKILTSGRYKFTSFPSRYAQGTKTFAWTFGAELKN